MNNDDWIKNEEIAKIGIPRVIKIIRNLYRDIDLKDIEEKASKGFIPNPHTWENSSKEWKRCIAGLIHLEHFLMFKDFLISILQAQQIDKEIEKAKLLLESATAAWYKAIDVLIRNEKTRNFTISFADMISDIVILAFSIGYSNIIDKISTVSLSFLARKDIDEKTKIHLINNIGTGMAKKKQYTHAYILFMTLENEIRELIKQGRTELLEDLASVLMNKGVSLRAIKRFEEAIAAYSEAEKIRRELIKQGRSELLEDLASVLMNKGVSLYSIKRFEEAIAAYSEAEEKYRELIKQGRTELLEDLARVLVNKGVSLDSIKRFEEAIAAYSEAEKIRRELIKQGRTELLEDLASVLMNKGVSLDSIKRFEEAIAAYSEAEEKYRELIKQGRTELLEDLASVLMNKGVSLRAIKRFEEAIAAYSEAEEKYRELIKQGRTELLEDLASVLMNKGVSLRAIKRFEEAIAAYSEAEEKYGELIKQGRTELLEDLASVLMNKGNTLYSIKRFEEAIAAYSEAEEKYGELIKQGRTELLEDLARVLVNKGVSLDSIKRFEEAIAAYSEAEKIRRELIKQGRTELLEDLASVLMNKGVSLRAIKRFEEAIAAYSEAEEKYRELIKQGRTELLEDLASVLMNKGVSLDSIKRFEEAIAAYSEAEEKAIKARDLETFIKNKVNIMRCNETLKRYNGVKLAFDDVMRKYGSMVRLYPGSFIRDIRETGRLFYAYISIMYDREFDTEWFLKSIEYIKYLPLYIYGLLYRGLDLSKVEDIFEAKDEMDFGFRRIGALRLNELELEILKARKVKPIALEDVRLIGRDYVFVSAVDTEDPFTLIFIVSNGEDSKLVHFKDFEVLKLFAEVIEYTKDLIDVLGFGDRILNKISRNEKLSEYEKRVIDGLGQVKGQSNYFDELVKAVSSGNHLSVRLAMNDFIKALLKHNYVLFNVLFEDLRELMEKLYDLKEFRDIINVLEGLSSEGDGRIIVFSPFGGLYLFPFELFPPENPLMFRRKIVRVFSLVDSSDAGETKGDGESYSVFALIDRASGLKMIDKDIESVVSFANAIGSGRNIVVKEVDGNYKNRKEVIELLKGADIFFYSGHGGFDELPDAPIYRSFLKLSSGLNIDFRDVLLASAKRKRFGAFLSTCKSGLLRPISATIDLYGILPAFIASGFKFVLAPVLPIEDRFANAYFDSFFREVAEGKRVADVLYEVRRKFKFDSKKRKIVEEFARDLLGGEADEELIDFAVNYLIWMVQLYGDPEASLNRK